MPVWPISVKPHIWDVLEKDGVGMLKVDESLAAAKRSWGGGKIVNHSVDRLWIRV